VRFAAARGHFGDDRVEKWRSLLIPGATAGIAYKDRSLIYPFLLSCPETRFTPIVSRVISRKKPDTKNAAYLLYIDTEPEGTAEALHGKILWQAKSGDKILKGSLVRTRQQVPQSDG